MANAKSTYKVGDTVTIRHDLEVSTYSMNNTGDPRCSWGATSEMVRNAGRKAVISEYYVTDDNCVIGYKLFFKSIDGELERSGWVWTDEMFENPIFDGENFHLQAGMFGVMSDGDKFVVVPGVNDELYIVYQNGSFDGISADYAGYSIAKLYSPEVRGFDWINISTPIWTMEDWKKFHKPKKMTVAEIEKELGYSVEIISD